MSAEIQNTTAGIGARLAGKYLTFVLGHESYAIPVLKVREIIRSCTFTPMPEMPIYVKGVVNLRGKIIPIVDLRQRFGFLAADGASNCVVVVMIDSGKSAPSLVGLIVDSVEEVAFIAAEDIEPTPDFGSALGTKHIVGMAKLQGAIKALLDIDQVFAA